MVKILNTVVTDAAVGAAWRAVEVAGGTPFHPYLDSFNLHVLVEWSSEVVVFIFIFVCSRENSRVHESCHAEVCQYKQEHEPIVHWDGWGDGFCQPGAPSCWILDSHSLVVQLGMKKVKGALVVTYCSVSLFLLRVKIYINVKLLQHLCRKSYFGGFGFTRRGAGG